MHNVEDQIAPEMAEPAHSSEQDASLEPEPSSAQEPDTLSTLSISLTGFDGECIDGLECRIRYHSATKTVCTDDNGKLPVINIYPGTEIEFSVKRFDGSYKVIDIAKVPTGDVTWEYVSPKIVAEVTTEPHEGVTGNAESIAPKPIEKDRGEITSPEKKSAPATKQTATPSTLPAPPPAPKKAANPQASVKTNNPPQQISGQNSVKKEESLKPGRDAKGHPQATFVSKVKDWWGSWRMPSLNLWTHEDFVRGGGKTTTQTTQPLSPQATGNGSTQAHSLVPTVNAEDIKHVNEIIDFLTMQADYKYGDSGTVAILTQMTGGAFKHQHGEKPSGTSASQCYKYVKVALVRTGWVSGALDGESASTAGPQLIKNGFIDVTDTLPDSRWAAPGDVCVYKWTQAVLDETRKRKRNLSYPNHGHIDVRSYDNYLTDYIPKLPMQHPNWSRYESPRVYRKFHDPLPILRMKAFLRCIREFECQEEKDETKRYGILNHSLPGTTTKYFTSYDTHPWDTVPKEQRSLHSAAGAYQIVYTSWLEMLTGLNDQGKVYLPRKMFGLAPKEPKFTPKLQDRMAVTMMEDRKALGHVRKGELIAAIEKLRGNWTSLPGGTENAKRCTAKGEPMDMAYFESLFNMYFAEEKGKAGVK